MFVVENIGIILFMIELLFGGRFWLMAGRQEANFHLVGRLRRLRHPELHGRSLGWGFFWAPWKENWGFSVGSFGQILFGRFLGFALRMRVRWNVAECGIPLKS